jgi:large subunit ribosomal protein L6
MSRIGLAPVVVPQGVEITVGDNVVKVKGPLGELTQPIDSSIKIEQKDGQLELVRENEVKQTKAYHGLYRSLLNNMVEGVTKGYEKKLELVGVGYRASNKGQELELSLGFSHNLVFLLPEEIKIETAMERGKNPIITLKSHDKQLIGQVCAKIRSFRKPEPYKGKGIKFVGEQIRRKAGKSAGKK